MAGLDRSPYLKQYYKTGQGNQSTQHKTKSVMTEEAKEKQINTVETVKDVVTAPFDFFKWICDNWQLATIGIIALYILIKE